MIRSTLFVLLLLSILFLNAYATPQIPDILIYEGKEYPIQSEFLEDYFKKYPERNPKREDEVCSALWRGYKATFEVVEAKIYLKDIVGNVCYDHSASELRKVVPGRERLFVDWISALVWSGHGENPENPYRLEYLNTYEKYSFFEVDKGRVREVRHFDNKGYRTFKKKQFEAFRKTAEFKRAIKEMLGAYPNMKREEVEASIQLWIPFNSTKFLVGPESRRRIPRRRSRGKQPAK